MPHDYEVGPITHNVPHGPFKIGDHVKVVSAADTEINRYFMGKTGVVIAFDYSDNGASYPKDPLITVQFSRSKDGFWKEELRKVK